VTNYEALHKYDGAADFLILDEGARPRGLS
jgi:hypothetical protein